MISTIQPVIDEAHQYCQTHDRAWNITPEQGKFLSMLIRAVKPRYILEVGTSFGYSTLWLGEAAKDIGACVTTIDIDPDKIDVARQFFQKAGLSDIVIIKKGQANKIVEHIAQETAFDFIFLDAGKDDYLPQFKTLFPTMKPGTICVADNAISHSENMRDFLDFVRNHDELNTVLIPLGHGMELIIKK
jgi:predicted O-methyltransferase YrrM